jgi:hypothetical protein
MAAVDTGTYTPLVPLLRARWMAAVTLATACAVTTLPARAMEVGAACTWAFAAAGVAGLFRARRWFCQRPGGEDEWLRVVAAGRVRSLRYPALALALIVARTGMLDWRITALTVSFAAAAIGGFNLASAAAAGRWQNRTAHRLLAPTAARPWIARSRLRADALTNGVPVTTGRPFLLGPILIVVCIVSALDMHALDASARAASASPGPTHVSRPFSAVSTQLAGHPVRVTCWSVPDWHRYQRAYDQRVAGVTWQGRIYLAPYVCGWLEWMRAGHWSSDRTNTYWLADSVGTLAHETGHAFLGRSEHDAECYALGHVATTAELLGLSSSRALVLQEVYRDRVHPKLPAAYTQPC